MQLRKLTQCLTPKFRLNLQAVGVWNGIITTLWRLIWKTETEQTETTGTDGNGTETGGNDTETEETEETEENEENKDKQ